MKLTMKIESNKELSDLYLKLRQDSEALKARLEQAIEDAQTSGLQRHVAQGVTRPAFTAAETEDGAD